MRLRNLFEALGQEVAIIFGRFNPPHKGHRAAWELASKSPVWFVGTNQSTQGPKDPLPYDVKVEAMKTVWPEVEGHIMPETGWLTMASKIYEKYPDATLLCLTDEDWVTKTIQQYNGKEGSHGYYNFKKIEQKPTPRLSSATALRDAVVKGDKDAFTQAAGVDADTPVAGKPFFDLVAEYLLPYQNAPKKVAKKKAAVSAEGVSESKPGWMLKQDPKLAAKVKAKTDLAKKRQASYGDPNAGKKFNDNPDDDWSQEFERRMKKGAAEGSNQHISPSGVKTNMNPSDDDYDINYGKNGLVAKFRKEKDVAEGDELELRRKGKTPAALGGADAWYHRGPMPEYYGFEKGSPEYIEYMKSFNDWDDGPSGGKQWEDAAGVGTITKQNTTKDVNKGTLRKMMKAFHLIDSMAKDLDSLKEAPIEMDPKEPMNPMIVGTKSNPAKLQYRMLRAANQLKDLAQRAQGASAGEWDMITRNFDELSMNIGEIKHALDELRKMRSKGGVRSRGIENF